MTNSSNVVGDKTPWPSRAINLFVQDMPRLSVDIDVVYTPRQTSREQALKWNGYRSTNRYLVFRLLPYTLGLGPAVWRVPSKCLDIRNLGEYEGDLNVDDRIVTDLVAACQTVAGKVDALTPLGATAAPGR